jgi:hypothetical protein
MGRGAQGHKAMASTARASKLSEGIEGPPDADDTENDRVNCAARFTDLSGAFCSIGDDLERR